MPRKKRVTRKRVANSKQFPAKAIIMPNGKVKVFVSPGVMAKIRKVNPGNYPLRTPDVVHSFSKKSEADVSLRLAQRGGKILTGEVAKVGKGYQLRLWLKK